MIDVREAGQIVGENPQIAGANPLSVLNVLVVDDDRDFAETMAEMLAQLGHRAASVFSGNEALNRLKKNVFDLAFVDIMMPGKGGLDVLWASQNSNIKTDIVLMTAHNAAHFADQGKMFSALGVLQKPFEPDQLAQYIEPDD